jgi:hypothetical protein
VVQFASRYRASSVRIWAAGVPGEFAGVQRGQQLQLDDLAADRAGLVEPANVVLDALRGDDDVERRRRDPGVSDVVDRLDGEGVVAQW